MKAYCQTGLQLYEQYNDAYLDARDKGDWCMADAAITRHRRHQQSCYICAGDNPDALSALQWPDDARVLEPVPA